MQEKFDKMYGKNSFELVSVADLADEGAFDEAVKGMFPYFPSVMPYADRAQASPELLMLLRSSAILTPILAFQVSSMTLSTP